MSLPPSKEFLMTPKGREWDAMDHTNPIQKPSTSEIIKKAVEVLTDLGFSSIQVTDGSVSLVINASLQKSLASSDGEV